MSTVSTNTATRPSSVWIVAPWWDLVYLVGSPVLIVPVVLILLRFWLTPEQVSLAVISFASLGHHLPGFMRAYGDAELFRRFRLRFLLVPPLVFFIAILFSPPVWLAESLRLPWKRLHGLELVLLFWGTWHGLMQTYGFLRIYDIRRGIVDRLSAWLDFLLCFWVFLVGVVFSDARVFGIAKGMWESGLPLFGPHWLDWLRIAVGFTGLGVLIAYLVNLARQHRAGFPVCWVKLLLIGITGWFYWYTGRLSVNVLVGIAMFEIYHALQYDAIVWIYNRRLFQRAGESFGPLGFMFRDRWTMLGLYLGAIAAYSSVRFFTVDANAYIFSGNSEFAYQLLVAAFVTSSLLHFYFDGFIWKVSERKTQVNLVDTPLGDTWQLSIPGTVHAAKWAGLLAIVAGLLISERSYLRNQPAGDQLRLAALAALTPRLPECHALLARDALKRGDAPTAIEHSRQALELRRGSHNAHADLGLAYLLDRQYSQAKAQFQAATAIAPREWSHHCDLGAALSKLGEFEAAEQEMQIAMQLGSDGSEPAEQLALFYLERNRTADAERILAQIAARFPESLMGELGKILLLNRRGEHREAVELASFLVAGNPSNWQVLLALGSSLNAAGEPQQALTPLERAVSLNPQSAEVFYQLGLSQFLLGTHERAVWALEQALKREPNHFAAQLQLANTYYVLGTVELAAKAYQRALGISPANPVASANLGGLLAQLGDFAEARRIYQAALAQHPDNPQLNYNLGLLLWQQGEEVESRKLLHRAEELGIQLSPEIKTAISSPAR